MSTSPRGRAVLVTGGTRGIGLATALAFAREGARTVLTCRWGSEDEAEIAARFRALDAPAPILLQADVGRAEDTERLFSELRDRVGPLDVFISNASSSLVVRSLEDYSERAFLKSLRASAWATTEYLLATKRVLGRYPRHVVVMSSDGPDHFTPGYDFAAASKSVVETLCRYLTYRLRTEDVRINVLRSRAVKTDSLDETFGADFHCAVSELATGELAMTAEDVGDAAYALCSGAFDAMRGQVVTADRGTTFLDGVSYVYERHLGGRP